MATFRETIYAILLADAQSAVAGSLGVLLEFNAVTKPRCIYYINGPEKPVLPILTYSLIAQNEAFPRTIVWGFTAWTPNTGTTSNNWEAVLKRVFDLMHKRHAITADDYSVKSMKFDGSSPDLFDENLKCYYRQDRYRSLAVRTPYPGNTGAGA